MLQSVQLEDRCLLAVASEQDRIVSICGDEDWPGDYRVFDGYSGWGAGQLEDELKSGGWIVWKISPTEVFSEPEDLWPLAIRCIGRDILSGGIDPARIPEDPAFN